MAFWLFKVEPSCYSYSDLERDGSTDWNGVTNALAQKHLRSVRKGDSIFYYHTGKDKAIVGVMEATADPSLDPSDPAGKRVLVYLKPVRRLKKPVLLDDIKADEAFAGWELVRMSRLSVMPVAAEVWSKIERMGES